MPAVTIHGMPRTPDITVAAIAQTAGRFLFVEERINNRLVFNQPAGHVEQGESLLAAVVREVYLWRRPSARRATLRFAFTGAVSDHHAHQRLDRGIVRTHWLSEAELLAHEERLRSPLVLRCVRDFLSGAVTSLDSVAQLDLESAAAVAPTARL
jgi:ADP-ribose pyrophosphatase YjhB (NUDIX family)